MIATRLGEGSFERCASQLSADTLFINIGKVIVMQEAQRDRMCHLLHARTPVDKIMEIVGVSRATVFRVRK